MKQFDRKEKTAVFRQKQFDRKLSTAVATSVRKADRQVTAVDRPN